VVVSAQLSVLPEMQTQFIEGYFSGLKARSPDLWEASVSRLLSDNMSREIGVAVLLRAGVSENIVRTLLDLFQQGRVRAIAFSRLAWQAEPNNIPPALVHSADDEALRVAIELSSQAKIIRQKSHTFHII